MLVHDPIARCQRPLADFLVEARTGDDLLLRSAKGGLFRFDPWTGTSSELLPVISKVGVSLQESETFSLTEAVKGDHLAKLVEGTDDPSILKAVFVCGDGGSGKTKIGDVAFAGLGFKTINQDTHLEKMLARAAIPLSQVGQHYGLQKKAQGLKNAEMRQFGLRRLGMVIDATGWDYERIAKPAKQLMKLGYDVYMVFVSTTLETALRRNSKRERVVPADFVTTAHKGAHENLPHFQKLLGKNNVFVINNDTDFSDATFDRIVAPALRKLGTRISKAKINNRIGKAWITDKKAKPGTDDVDTKEWPSEKKPLIPALPAAKQKANAVQSEAQIKAKTPKKWMVAS